MARRMTILKRFRHGRPDRGRWPVGADSATSLSDCSS